MVVNAFLALMDGIARDEGVVVVATCNHPELIDPGRCCARAGSTCVWPCRCPTPQRWRRLRRHLTLPEPERSCALAQQAVSTAWPISTPPCATCAERPAAPGAR